MKTNLPTTPGPYWWRSNDECDWDPVYVREDSTVPGYEYTVLFPETGVEIDLPDLLGQWAKAHKPDEGQEAFAVRCPNGQFTYISTEDDCDKQCEHLNETDMFLDGQEYDVVPVTIYRRWRNDQIYHKNPTGVSYQRNGEKFSTGKQVKVKKSNAG